MLLIGVGLLLVSAFYASSYLAIIGVSVIFWAAIFLYLKPSQYVPLSFLNASANVATSNIERLILEFNLMEKGIYLPPQNLKNIDSSLIFVPETSEVFLPTSEETNDDRQFTKDKTGALITPPGLNLSKLFEEEMGFSFIKNNLANLQFKLPKILEDFEIAENVEFQIKNNIVTVEITGSIFNEVCRGADSNPKTHKQVGCLLSSAIACTLAKTAGRPVIIQNETRNQETRKTNIEYEILENNKIKE